MIIHSKFSSETVSPTEKEEITICTKRCLAWKGSYKNKVFYKNSISNRNWVLERERHNSQHQEAPYHAILRSSGQQFNSEISFHAPKYFGIPAKSHCLIISRLDDHWIVVSCVHILHDVEHNSYTEQHSYVIALCMSK